MTRYVVDSSAWIDYFIGAPRGQKIRKYVDDPTSEIYITPLIAAEVFQKFAKKGQDLEQVKEWFNKLAFIAHLNIDIAAESAKVYVAHRKKKHKFGLADAIIFSVAKELQAKVITCDNDFTGLSNVLTIRN